jgi:hypothetical protein
VPIAIAAIHREKGAFETPVRQKAHMPLPTTYVGTTYNRMHCTESEGGRA